MVTDLLREELFQSDYAQVLHGLAGLRIGQPPEFSTAVVDRLHGLVEYVLATPEAGDERYGEIALRAGNAALILAAGGYGDTTRLHFRAAMLYEMADRPMMAAAVVDGLHAPKLIHEYFARRGPYSSLSALIGTESEHNGVEPDRPLLAALAQRAWALAEYQLGEESAVMSETADRLLEVAMRYGLDLNATDVAAFERTTRLRAKLSTREHVPDDLLTALATGQFPPELWSGQAVALSGGLLDERFDAWSFSAPTGTGKTFLARLLILATLRAKGGSKVLYIVPSRALVRQVSTDLSDALGDLSVEVVAIKPQLIALDDDEDDAVSGADVLVLTPEKADLLIRINAKAMERVALVVVDEAHHIESGTRGVLLELYLWRLRELTARHARFVFMSAVAPNVDILASWMGRTSGGVTVSSRATGMRVGVFEHRKPGRFVEGWIRYTDGTDLRVIDKKADRTQVRGIPQLAAVLGRTGPVLVVAKGKKTAENLARAFVDALPEDADCRLDQDALKSGPMQRLDSRLEREMYSDVPLRDLMKAGVAYHHAGLPPRVREAVEAAISERHIKYVFATTTLAEGVNFPFSSVIVQSLATRDFPVDQAASWRLVTPRSFWNIAGRAGRAGFDYEGQVVLYGPSLALDKTSASIEPYLESDVRAIDPVGSALAKGMLELRKFLGWSTVSLNDLSAVELSKDLPREARGFLNLLRVGIAHARASGLEASPRAFFNGTLAAREFADDSAAMGFAQVLVDQQTAVVDAFLESPGAPSERLLAELGLSLDTLSRLRSYVAEMSDTDFERVLGGIPGGYLRARSLRYFFSQVMSRMAEPEGTGISGFLAEIVVEWCQGIPFSRFTNTLEDGRLEDLISLMYTRVQYLLPWALYAVDRFFAEECIERGKSYDGQVRSMAYLVDAGVPNFSALRLANVGIERTDATRLAKAHAAVPATANTTNVIDWIRAQRDETLIGIVRGEDRRRLDFDFLSTVRVIRTEMSD